MPGAGDIPGSIPGGGYDNPNLHHDPRDTNYDGVVSEQEKQAAGGSDGFHLGGGGGGNPGSGGGSGGSSGSSGGSSSSPGGSSSSGGSSAAPADPNAQLIAEANSLYLKLWGQTAPANYTKHLIDGGMNIWEFEDHERHKPAFRHTKTYHDEASNWAGQLTAILGR